MSPKAVNLALEPVDTEDGPNLRLVNTTYEATERDRPKNRSDIIKIAAVITSTYLHVSRVIRSG